MQLKHSVLLLETNIKVMELKAKISFVFMCSWFYATKLGCMVQKNYMMTDSLLFFFNWSFPIIKNQSFFPFYIRIQSSFIKCFALTEATVVMSLSCSCAGLNQSYDGFVFVLLCFSLVAVSHNAQFEFYEWLKYWSLTVRGKIEHFPLFFK